ncbi:DUF1349 domain-containing protein [Leucobacter sp. UCD-THU]|uniref:DUF1349 domain-containing protein n=1 Tax=Leucobacter sp. UCD-THU TaxID=1292023 RepID=UPI0009DA751A|nr:DUF1349 domain-containing protein [Leucobacter sp. UCD-THU]
MSSIENIQWVDGTWTHPPARISKSDVGLCITAKKGSDAWRNTSYGFIHDSEHALVVEFANNTAMEVEFTANFAEEFDQAGIFIKSTPANWIKAGVEYADGQAQLGAVVTNPNSDWSLAPVPDWNQQRILIRASRVGGAITIRACINGNELQLVRVIPFSSDLNAQAGPFVCAPTRAGLTVPFHTWQVVAPDSSLH